MIDQLFAAIMETQDVDFMTEDDLLKMRNAVSNEKLIVALNEGLWRTEVKKFMKEEFVEGKAELIMGAWDRRHVAIKTFEPKYFPKGIRAGFMLGSPHESFFISVEDAKKLQAYLNRELSN